MSSAIFKGFETICNASLPLIDSSFSNDSGNVGCEVISCSWLGFPWYIKAIESNVLHASESIRKHTPERYNDIMKITWFSIRTGHHSQRGHPDSTVIGNKFLCYWIEIKNFCITFLYLKSKKLKWLRFVEKKIPIGLSGSTNSFWSMEDLNAFSVTCINGHRGSMNILRIVWVQRNFTEKHSRQHVKILDKKNWE